jgi:hypothetical protein
MLDRVKLDTQLIRDEALELYPYDDKTGHPIPPGGVCQGNLTTGVGHNLDAKPLSAAQKAVIGHDGRTLPITHDQAIWLLHCDEVDAMNDLTHRWPWWSNLDDVRARVLIGLCFNMGAEKLSEFVHFMTDMCEMSNTPTADLAALASRDLQNSAWYGQTGKRGERYVSMVLTGQDAA